MPNSFRITPASITGVGSTSPGLYVSKAGQDSNNGTADAPKASILSALQSGGRLNHVIGAGTYYWPTQLNSADQYHGGFIADGTVKILGDGLKRLTPLAWADVGFRDITLDKFGGFLFRGYQYSTSAVYQRCIFKVVPENQSTPNSSSNSVVLFSDCIFFNLNGNLGNAIFDRCLFFNCKISVSEHPQFCYFDPTCSIEVPSVPVEGPNHLMNKNNVDPRTNTDLGYGFNIANTGWTKTTPGGISQLPEFNDTAREDFSLRKSSPHVTNGIGPTHLRYANPFFSEFTGGSGELVTAFNVRFKAAASNAYVELKEVTTGAKSFEVNSQGGLVLKPSSSSDGEATFKTNRIPFSQLNEEMVTMDLKAGLNYNSDFPALEGQFNFNAPETYNNNVPDFSNSQPGSAGRNPNRLTYRMRWSTKIDPSVDNPDDWVTGTNWIEFEWNTKPVYNAAQNRGNGAPDFDPATATAVVCRWYQLEIRLRNNYFR